MSDEETPVKGTVSRSRDSYTRSLEQLQELRRFNGEPSQFWYSLLQILSIIGEATSGVIIVRNLEGDRSWQLLALAPQSLRGGPYARVIAERVETVEERLLNEETVQWSDDGERLAALRLATGDADKLCLAVLTLPSASSLSAKELGRRLLLAMDVPAAYQTLRIAEDAKVMVERFAGVLDLLVLLNEQQKFLPAAMTFCNEVSARLHCERVSIGWIHRGYVRLQATSHVERFDRKSDAVQLLEAAMEEALDQSCEVSWPEDQGSGPVTRDHRSFARAHDAGHLYSLPLRSGQEVQGVCTCERKAGGFSPAERGFLRLLCDQTVRRLSDLKRWDRWFGARLALRFRESVGRLVGFKHTWKKVLGILVAALVGVLVLARVPYRVSAPLTLKTDDLATVTAPFAGHIEKVDVRVGDQVKEGEELLALDRTDLLLAEAQIVAEMESYRSEFDKARAAYSLADMRINEAREEQAAARYEAVRYHLRQSIITAPFSGIVVEGDLSERIGLPVNPGDTLFKLAKIDRIYAVLEVSERDIRDIQDVRFGEMALITRPEEASPIQVTLIEPQAVAKPKGTVFRVDCSFPKGVRTWWRPGMTGIAKLSVGTRTPLWLLTHRTADFLRLKLWW